MITPVRLSYGVLALTIILAGLLHLAVPLLVAGMLSGCSNNKSGDVTDNIRKSLDQAGFKDVSVSEDRDKGVVTLKGSVPTETDKQQAESIAKSSASNLVVADEISVFMVRGGK